MEWNYDCLIGERSREVRFPSDGVDPCGLDGRCLVYALGKPMSLRQLEAMPQDLQRAYLRRLRQRGGTRETVGKMLHAAPEQVAQLQARYHVAFDRPDPAAWASFCQEGVCP